jgi:tetratricopeptide (TPR) repeat protein
MDKFWQHLSLSFVLLMGVGCAGPTYVDKSKPEIGNGNPFSKVIFQVHDAYQSEPPACVAILPFATKSAGDASDKGISVDQSEAVRRAVYAHLSPQGKRDIELPRVDFVLRQMMANEKSNMMLVGEGLQCDAILQGEVTEYGSEFLAVYSRVAVGAKLRLISAKDGALLWEGEHVAESHGGAIPLSPIGLAMGIIDAASNVNEEQLFRVIDDLARRLVKTIPDNRVAVLEEPLTKIKEIVKKKTAPKDPAEALLASLEGVPQKEKTETLLKAIEDEQFSEQETAELYKSLTDAVPSDPRPPSTYADYLVGHGNYQKALHVVEKSISIRGDVPETHFLKGRILIKLKALGRADSAIVKAVALDGKSSDYLNGLGYVNSLRGNHERALAAYRLALQSDPANGYAYYNIGVTLFNLGDMEEAADAFYGSGLAYLKSGNFGQVEKSLADLKELAKQGLPVLKEIDILNNALEELSKQEMKNAKT